MRNRLVALGLSFAVVFGVLLSQAALAQGVLNFNNSPNNWVNSPNNFDNSSNNWVNSPNNFNNSPNNYSATNGVFDNRGNRVGYEVPSPSGVVGTECKPCVRYGPFSFTKDFVDCLRQVS